MNALTGKVKRIVSSVKAVKRSLVGLFLAGFGAYMAAMVMLVVADPSLLVIASVSLSTFGCILLGFLAGARFEIFGLDVEICCCGEEEES